MTIKAFTFLLLFSAGSTLASEVQLVPLQEYIANVGVAKDPAALGYIADRCSALYTVFAKNLEKEIDPSRSKLRAEFANAGEKFMSLAVQAMMRGTTIRIGDAMTRTRNTVIGMGNLYTVRIDAVRDLTNNMFSDALIAGDFATCKGLLKHQ